MRLTLPLRAAAALSAILIGACSNFGQNNEIQAVGTAARHPITVDTQAATLMIPVTADATALSAEDLTRLDAFAAQYKARGDGPLVLSVPSGGGNQSAATRAAAEAETWLQNRALTANQIRLSQYRASSAAADAPLILSFTQYVATPSPCGNWSKNYAFNPRNTASPNFGCASRNNLAVMVSNPADLVKPRTQDPADAQRRDVVLEKYRAGEITATDRDDRDEANVSQAIGN